MILEHKPVPPHLRPMRRQRTSHESHMGQQCWQLRHFGAKVLVLGGRVEKIKGYCTSVLEHCGSF